MVEFLEFIGGIGIGFLIAHLRTPKYREPMYFWMQKYEELFNDYEAICSQYADLDQQYIQLKRRTEDEEA